MAKVFGNKKLTIQQVKQVDGQFKNISEVWVKYKGQPIEGSPLGQPPMGCPSNSGIRDARFLHWYIQANLA